MGTVSGVLRHGTMGRPNANPILAVMRDDDFSDPWGTAMAWAFGVAEVLNAAGEDVPESLEFQPSPYVYTDPDVQPEEYPDAYVWGMLHGLQGPDATVEDLQMAGKCLARYIDWCKLEGLDY